MDKSRQDILALRQAILHWKEILLYTKTQPPDKLFTFMWFREESDLVIGGSSCPLCQLEDRRHPGDDSCKDCAIALDTENDNCIGTPWELICKAHTYGTATKAAQAEVDYLEKLLVDTKRRYNNFVKTRRQAKKVNTCTLS